MKLRTNRSTTKAPNSSAFVVNEKLKTRIEKLDNIRYLVAPVVMVREQVLNGELLPAEEIEKSTLGWNGRPVVVYHPRKDNEDSSANDPDVVETYEVGRIYNTEYDPDSTKLKGEIWVDIGKVRKNENTRLAYEMIKNSEELEVSTGYFVNDRIPETGEFDGVEYIAIQREILPDHLALLPNEIGACSWEDGAGVRNNSAASIRFNRRAARRMHANMDIPINQMLQEALTAYNVDIEWIENTMVDDMGNTFVVYTEKQYDTMGNQIWPSLMYMQYYDIDAETGSVVLGDTPQRVEPVMQYIPTNNSVKEEKALNKKALVKAVITNSAGKFTAKDVPALNKMQDAILIKMLPANVRSKFTTTNKSKAKQNRRNRGGQRSNRMSINEVMELPLDEIEDFVEELISDAESGDDAAVAELEQLETELMDEEAVLGDVIDEIGTFLDGEPEADPMDDPQEEQNSRRRRNKRNNKTRQRANLDTSEITDPESDEFEDDEVELVAELATLAKKRAQRKNKRKTGMRGNEDLEQLLDDEEIDDVVELDPSNEAQEVMAQQFKAQKAALIRKIAANSDFRARELSGYKYNQLLKIAKGLKINMDNLTGNANYSLRGMQMRNNKEEDNLPYTPLSANIFQPKK